MRVLHIGFVIPALCKALKDASDDYLFMDWTVLNNDIPTLHAKTIEIANEFNPDLILIHVQVAGVYNSEVLSQLPGFKINWTWDYREPTLPWIIECSKAVDVTGFTNDTDVCVMSNLGIRSEFIQGGFDHETFKPEGSTGKYPRIVFIGNNYPKDDYTFPLADYRTDMINMLRNKYGEDFGIFGFGWNNGLNNFMYREHKEAECYRSCEMAINLSHFDAGRYTSDRLFRLMGSGAFCLCKWYPDFEKDFEDGVHLRIWHNFDELNSLIEYYTEHVDERRLIAEAGCKLVHGRNTWKHMAANIIKIAASH